MGSNIELSGLPLQDLQKLKDLFRDDIPSVVIHSDFSDSDYKVRRNWFQGVVAVVSKAIDKGLITDPVVLKQTEVFIDRVTAKEFIRKPLTEKKDIDEANGVINAILGV